MAGIGGWSGAPASGDRAALARLLGGPQESCWLDGAAAVGWSARRRSGAGSAPAEAITDGLAVADDYVVAFDGVLAERDALRIFIERRGLPVARGHDAELVLLAWRALGDAALDRLDGTFAIAVWARAARELTLARDRLGGRGLAWAEAPTGVVFASSVAQLAAYVGAARDEARVFEVLVQGHVSPPHTTFRGVRTVEPGHLVRVSARGQARARRYFAPSFIARTGAADELGPRLEAVVRDQLASTRVESRERVAVLLDGAAGGAAIATLAGPDLRSVSVRLGDEDDLGAAQAAALGSVHRVLELSPDSISVARAVHQVGGPFATPWPLLAPALASEVDVVFSALGAESLAGAPPRLAAVSRGGGLGPRTGRALRWGAERVADVTVAPLRRWLESAAALGGASETPLGRRLLHTEGVFAPEVLTAILRPNVRAALFDVTRWSDRVVDEATSATQLGRSLARRVRSRLAEELVPGLDQPLAAAGVELRLPFFDRHVVELASGLEARERPQVLDALSSARVPHELDADEARMARWMGGVLEPLWREAVFGDSSPLVDLIDPARVRPLLLADVAWNPGRWRQALALWTLSVWLSAPAAETV